MATLIRAWTDEEFDEFCQYLIGNASEQGLREAFAQYPKVFAAYRLDHATNWFAGTPFANVGFSGTHYIKEHLNSRRPIVGATDYSHYFYPITVEIEMSPNVWSVVPDMNGMEVWDDGTIWIPGLRWGPQKSWGWNGASWTIEGSTINIVPRNIRFSCVVFGDHRYTMVANQSGMTAVQGGAAGGESQQNYNLDVARFVKTFSRVESVDNDLYHIWFRDANSKPVPESITPTGQAPTFPAKLAYDELRNDATMQMRHAQRRLWEQGRLRKSGSIRYDGQLVPGAPGMQVEKIDRIGGPADSFNVNAVIIGVLYESRDGHTRTTHYLG